MFCKNCGKELPNGAAQCPDCTAVCTDNPSSAKTASVTEKTVTNTKTLRFISGAVAMACAILPFLHWVEVPILNSITSFLGGSGKESSYSLFGYILSDFAASSNDMTMALIILAFGIIALISSVINVIYAIKCFTGNKTSLKLGKAGSVILLIMSILFLIVIGLIAAIFKIISLTFAVYVAIALPIANIIIIKQIKKTENA